MMKNPLKCDKNLVVTKSFITFALRNVLKKSAKNNSDETNNFGDWWYRLYRKPHHSGVAAGWLQRSDSRQSVQF
jgi:hypothetical protein